ncbi:hypothetical protein G9A89_006899 [Geosiphon pyriformis]|nr:hypothetical protein G9A89_006899 [Geosiphon pyriformis]
MPNKKNKFHKLPPTQTEFDEKGGKIKRIKTWADIEHDSEDEFHDGREKIFFDAHKKNQIYDHELELSEEEVLPFKTDESSVEELEEGESEELEEDEPSRKITLSDSDQEMDNNSEEEFDSQTWGHSKSAYYNADDLSDLDEAKEEEAEALRLRKKRISKMAEEDFLENHDGAQWKFGALEKDEQNDRQLIESVNQDLSKISMENNSEEVLHLQKRVNLPRDELLKILQNNSPELIELANEFREKLSLAKSLSSILEKFANQNIKPNEQAHTIIKLKYQTLINYLTNISFYFVLKSTSTPRLQEHPIFDALVDFKKTLNKIESLENMMKDSIKEFTDKVERSEKDDLSRTTDSTQAPPRVNPKSVLKTSKNLKNAPTTKKVTIITPDHSDDDYKDYYRETEKNLANSNSYWLMSIMGEEFRSLKNKNKFKRKRNSTDLGDLDVLDEIDAEEKAQKKNSLRHYTARVNQNLVKRTKFQRYSGDADIPYKDQKITEVKEPGNLSGSADLDDQDWDDDDKRVSLEMDQQDPNDYYDQMKEVKKAQKLQKKIQYEAQVEAKRRIHEDSNNLLEGAKRQINYQILKNKGLTPHRKKEQRNPRVKHRQKYEKAKKKIKSVRHVVTPQEGSYGGEKTGIKIGLSRSIKLG